MAHYKCNAPGGTFIHPRGLIPFEEDFTVADYEEPRNSWIPLDDAANAAFDKFNAGKAKDIEDEANKDELKGKERREYIAKQTKLRLRIPNRPVVMVERRPLAEIERAKAELAALEAKDKGIADKIEASKKLEDPSPFKTESTAKPSTRTADQ